MTENETYDRTLDTPPAPPAQPPHLPDEEYYRQPQRSNSRRLGMALLIVGLIWLASMAVGRGPLFGGERGLLLDQQYSGSRLEMDIGTGSVEVRPSDNNQIQVEATYRGGSPEDYDVNVSESGGTVRINGGPRPSFFFFSRDVNYEIRVPANAAMDIKTVNGQINVEGIDGAVTLNSTNGDIEASDLSGGATVGTVNGDVKLREIGGKLNITTTNGDVELEDGSVTEATVRTTNGEVTLEGVSNNLDVETVNGEVKIGDARDGRLRIETANGDIEYEGSLAPGGANAVTTLAGDVRIRLPDDSGFSLNANTISGDLETSFDLQNRQEDGRNLRGTVGGGQATLEIETTNGDVHVERQ